MDDDVSGEIQFPEFARFFIGKMKSNDIESQKYFGEPGEGEVKMAMEAMLPGSSDGDGITKDAIKKTMTDCGFKLSEEDLDCMITSADISGDGKVNVQELRRMLKSGTCGWPLV